MLNETYLNKIIEIYTKGKIVNPRSQEVRELTNQIITMNPEDNIITIPGLKTNIEYAQLEYLWYLSGTNKINVDPKIYSIWKKYSDDGETVNSAYGYRIFGNAKNYVNQYEWVKNKLKTDPDTRQAIININSFEDKNNKNTKDFPCLSGNTIVHSPEGNITIGTLANYFKKGLTKFPVWSINEDTKELELDYVRNCWLVGKKQVIYVILDNNDKIICTPNHKFLIKKRIKLNNEKPNASSTIYVWLNAEDLQQNDKVVYIRYYPSTKCLTIKKNFGGSSNYKNRVNYAREYLQFLKEYKNGDCVHHINFNWLDNRFKNLLSISNEKHAALHRVLKNPNKKAFQYEILKNKINSNWHLILPFNNGNKIKKIIKRQKYRKTLKTMVFDLSTEKNNNFFINGGICVHNCTIALQYYIRENKLHSTTMMRSNDIYFGFRNDIYAFTELQKKMAKELNIQTGDYNHFTTSLHLYSKDYAKVEKIIGKQTELVKE